MRIRKRAWVCALVGPLPQAIGSVGLPLGISRLGRIRGWQGGRPGPVNLLGLLPLTAGAGVLGWAVMSHYRAAPDDMELTVVPTYLATGGAYRLTRNPMYVGGALMQTGWALLLGSLPAGLTTVAYMIGMDRCGIPFEERLLHDRFGRSYDAYARAVPRWLGPAHRNPDAAGNLEPR